jgi:hypothetical protein
MTRKSRINTYQLIVSKRIAGNFAGAERKQAVQDIRRSEEDAGERIEVHSDDSVGLA